MQGLFLFAWLIAWSIGIISWIANWKDASNRWLGAVLVFLGCGALAVFVKEACIPFFEGIVGDNTFIVILRYVVGISSSIAHCFLAYAFLMFGISYSKVICKWRSSFKNALSIVLIIPSAVMYAFIPVYPDFYIDYPLPLFVWVIPYVVCSDILLVYSYFNSSIPSLKRQSLLICLIIIPMTVTLMINNLIIPSFDVVGAWRTDFYFILIFLSTFLYFVFKYGFMGFKFNFERTCLDDTMKSFSTGTAIINHTIKNEAAKISLCASNIKFLAEGNDKITKNLEYIISSTNHMMEMTKRVKDCLGDMALKEQPCGLNEVAGDAIKMVSIHTTNKNITIGKDISDKIKVLCDPLHIREVLINIFTNAIEAIESEGHIKIYTDTSPKAVILCIKDNGKGIGKENLTKVFQPFFTTKGLSTNFGLGLSYCYNVMKKHGGWIDIQSDVKSGTTIFIGFPISRLVNSELFMKDEGNRCGRNKSYAG